MPLDCRLILDGPAPGAWNMAVDEALLESAADGGQPTLRFYQWAEPTLSLGYFQAYADRDSHLGSHGLACVRRSSGGGALVHDRELTYSLALPPEAAAGRDSRQLYCRAHRAVIAAVEQLGGSKGQLSLCDPNRDGEAPASEPFLCFQRRADGDLLVGGPHPRRVTASPIRGRFKVCGSAQRKRRGALLQHGGVLLAESPRAPELPGLAELGVLTASAKQLTPVLLERMSEGLGLDPIPGELTAAETLATKRLASEKHAAEVWIRRR